MSNRRTFLTTLAALLASAGLPRAASAAPRRDRIGELLPTRPLGRTGRDVTMLGLGGWHIGRMSERDAQATIETALEGGIRFFDTAESYQDGVSEERLGTMLVPKHRDAIFLMTKSTAKDRAEAERHLEGSLRRLKVDHVDLWQMHAVSNPKDVDDRISRGVLDVMIKAKQSGKARHIGFTGHAQPTAHRRVLERTDVFETAQMPINIADPSFQSFVEGVVPRLVERKMGVLAMKTLANGGFFGGSQQGEHGDNPKLVPDRVSIREALSFVWSLPVSVLITGPDNPDHLREKIALARSFEPLNEPARAALVTRVADLAGARVEYYTGDE
jgi:aryl-alcohol dehydrogenase-like predicted oxidoreductase